MKRPFFVRLRQGYFADAIVGLILGEISEAEARRLAVHDVHEIVALEHTAQLEFYVGACKFAQGDRRGFKRHMAKCAKVSGLSLSQELLMARYECGMFPFQERVKKAGAR